MAYGELRVRDKGELDSFLHEMRNQNKLPKKLNDDCISDSNPKRASSSYLPACFNPKKAVIAPIGFEYMPEERVFPRKFMNLVLRCLNPDQAKRSTAHKLVRSRNKGRWTPTPKNVIPCCINVNAKGRVPILISYRWFQTSISFFLSRANLIGEMFEKITRN